MNITRTPLEGLLLIESRCFKDENGFFLEAFQMERSRVAGILKVKRPQAQIVTDEN